MSNNNAANKLISKVEGRVFTLKRIFNAPRELASDLRCCFLLRFAAQLMENS
ncbi:hypothetical protein SAMN03159341_102378 [Paenibacillus sp. 1_12]|uniref:hypothetical protein n=1 Tax=Paenibacillus sp. 1_12 TaxID=1566278 RepID=UPI0008E2C782|nr:hypothetical protein [Paenibacillus sp. 1_12]SFK95762.1 hypothetical protein SAMN03159341_102378 [Paenibacillus sp. 1_12]